MRVLNKGGALLVVETPRAGAGSSTAFRLNPAPVQNETYLEIGTGDEATFELTFRGNKVVFESPDEIQFSSKFQSKLYKFFYSKLPVSGDYKFFFDTDQ